MALLLIALAVAACDREPAAKDTVTEVDRSADRIADLVIRYMTDEEAPKLFHGPTSNGRYDQ